MVDGTELVELEDRWLLPYRSMQVTQIRVSYQLTLVLDGEAQVDLEAEAVLSEGPLRASDVVTSRLVPERQEVAPALALFGTTLLSSVAFKSGMLRLVFDSGMHLNVKPDAGYEAWSVHGPESLCLVCMPGGDVAVWQ
ncbi:hypothetical protein EDD27_9825 [Nonomuraea polychroma]|uniref:Uncharacterized protein n=1 Tax=Nonomuraea polychroma TaxID=46176 RepID=A0A438MMA7_9ACTN|nr:DUF6188 family protein [Nonomuraea polychroma]RVX46912.1 hypothetical protein EDD27_9825 [Nonomuraea polychroma]